jgi:nucleoside-diphosphate-sugar epimerase
MSILITGATGFIGGHLARTLAEQNETVHVLCRSTANIAHLQHDNIQMYQGDILDMKSIEHAIEDCDVVYHLAAYACNWAKDDRTFFELNVGGMKNILDTALNANVKRVVFTSTGLTMGPSNGVPADESTERNEGAFTIYEYSKLRAEEEARRYAQNGLDVVIVNPTRVFGPGLLNEGNSVTRMIQWYLEGKWRLILGDGSLVGNYAFVEDVVRGELLAMERGKSGERYILGGENTSFNELFDVISSISGRKHRLYHVPGSLALTFSQVERLRARWFDHYPLITPGWVRVFLTDWACSTTKAQTELGYRITPLREALTTTIQWLKKSNGQ